MHGASAQLPVSDLASKARTAAQEFVAMALIQPVLKQLRQSNQAAAPFAPGAHEKTFGAMLDSEIAKRIVQAKQFPLVDAVAESLTKRRGEIELARDVLEAPGIDVAGQLRQRG